MCFRSTSHARHYRCSRVLFSFFLTLLIFDLDLEALLCFYPLFTEKGPSWSFQDILYVFVSTKIGVMNSSCIALKYFTVVLHLVPTYFCIFTPGLQCLIWPSKVKMSIRNIIVRSCAFSGLSKFSKLLLSKWKYVNFYAEIYKR